jgi:AbiV family abortive infection protein
MIKNKQYRGELNAESAAKGMDFAFQNAISLLDDAVLLYNNNRYERAFSLSILAIEEVGKLSIIREIILETDSV